MKWMFYEGNALGFKGHKMTDKSIQWNKPSKLLIDLQGQWIQAINISALWIIKNVKTMAADNSVKNADRPDSLLHI